MGMFTLMGFFATYCGLIYNEFFSVPLPWPGSCWEIVGEGQNKQYQYVNMGTNAAGKPSPRYGTCVFPFGLDYAWGATSNDVLYFNS